ncbi:MAG: hypothetical protein ABR543_03110 [Gemmatimonadaceae bacterium]
MVYVGLDLHKRYITACAPDAEGQVLGEARHLSTEVGALLVCLRPREPGDRGPRGDAVLVLPRGAT